MSLRNISTSLAIQANGVVFLLGCLALLSAYGCGRKTPVRPPEYVAPERIKKLRARNEDAGIRLRWERPRRYADGSKMPNLAGFNVQRSRDTEPFELLATLEVTDRERFRQVREFEYLDIDTTDTEFYRYQVLSFTLGGDISKPSNQAEVVRLVPDAAPPAAGTPTTLPPHHSPPGRAP